MTFHRGQFVRLTYDEQTVTAMVMLASPNGRSLMLGFRGVLRGHGGVFPGAIPLLLDEDGIYRDLIKNEPAQVAPIKSQ